MNQVVEMTKLREGQIIGRELVEAEDDGRPVTRIRTVSGRAVDRLEWAGAITGEEYTAATRLRDNWELGRLVAGARAAGRTTQGSGARTDKAEKAWDRHRHCFDNIGGTGTVRMLTAVVLEDIKPVDYARGKSFHGPTNFSLALKRLLTYFERNSRIWDTE